MKNFQVSTFNFDQQKYETSLLKGFVNKMLGKSLLLEQ